MTKGRTIRLDILLLIFLSLVLLLTRVVNLNARSLTDYEADHALDAAWDLRLDSTVGFSEEPVAPQSPLYHFITHLFFQFLGDRDAVARATPAIGGLLLLFFIWILWRGENNGLRLIWLFILGFSPVLITISRTASGDILSAAALFAMMLLLFPENQPKQAQTSILLLTILGIGLTTGAGIFRGVSSILITAFIVIMTQRDRFGQWLRKTHIQDLSKYSWLLPVTILVVLSGFGSSLAGFRGFATMLELWLYGWVLPSGYSFLELVVLLITTEPLILFFGILGIIWFWRDQEISGWMASSWALGSGIFLLLYPGRSPLDLIWILLPLSYLAALAISSMLQSIQSNKSKQELLGLVVILAIFLASGALSLVAYGTGNIVTINAGNPNLLVYLFLALAIMGVSVLVFFGIGWSWSVVAHAVGVFLLLIGYFQGIASTWRLNFSRAGYELATLWWRVAPAEGLPIAVRTLEQTALAFSGQKNELPLEIRGELPPSLVWSFRDFEKRYDVATFGLEASPVILVREEDVQANFSADYIGQSLALRQRRAWDSLLPPAFFRWLITGTAPFQTERWVIWVRVDIASFGDIGLESR